MDRFDTMKAFVSVAAEGSFTRAAEKLQLSNQLISKYVAQLENQLGVRLLNRTTRKVHLTEAGERCLEHSRQILESLSDMEGSLGQLHQKAQGLLHISAPVSFGCLHLAPLISDFHRRYPEVGVNLQVNDRKVDVLEEGFDLALRIGRLKDSSLVAKRITTIRLCLCAAPSYCEQHGTPKHPNELKPQHYLRYSYLDPVHEHSELMMALKRMDTNRKEGVTSNNGDLLTQAAIRGDGYVLQPSFIVSSALQSEKLRILLPEYEPEPLALYAVYPHRKLLASKLRVFIDFIHDYFGDPPYWDQDR